MSRILHVCIILVLSLIGFLTAGTTGKIVGSVTDEQGEPLIGVNVVIKDTYMGASTDLDGNYVIVNIPPGSYTVEFTYIGFQPLEITSVNVSVDFTTTLNAKLQVESLESEVITIIAERPLLKKDLTASTAVVNSEQISSLPVTEISEVLELQAGMVDGHVRGGRTGEIAYWIDGVPVTDAFDGGTVVDINKDMVEELQFISGAFNAEYGQAMSGIVNITTKEPRKPFSGSFNFYSGDYYSTQDDIFLNLNNFNPANIYNIDGGIAGIIIPEKLSYYLNARYVYFSGYYFGERTYNPWNVSYRDDATGEWVLTRDESGSGDGKLVPMNWNRRLNTQAKLIFNLSPTIKLSYNFIRDDMDFQEYDRAYRYNPDGLINKFRIGNTNLIKMTHMLSNSTYYDLGISYFDKSYKQYMFKDKDDERWVHPSVGSNLPSNNFNTGGMSNQYFERQTKTLLLKFDISSQLNRRHFLKAGLEARRHELSFDDIQLQPQSGTNFDYENNDPFMQTISDVPVGSVYRSNYLHKPMEYSAYIQDKMEFDDIILNIGFRIDHFQPDAVVLADPSDPDVYRPTKPINAFKDLNGDGLINLSEATFDNFYTLDERKEFWYKDAKSKTQISPRLGVSFPITETGIVHFSYGHFFQIPNFEFLYRNPQFQLFEESENKGLIGNADLRPQQTISAEIGLQQQVSEEVVLDVTAFFRDVRDLVGSRADAIRLFTGGTYSKLVNSDFGFIKGIVLSLRNRFSKGINYTVDYTFQIASGTSSDPNQARNALAAGNLPEVHLVPLGWDQLHTLNSTFGYNAETWGISFIGSMGSGLPFTPRQTTDVSALRENSEKKPITWNVDTRLYKNILLFGTEVTFYVRVFNLFDHLNETGVYDDTGRAGYTTDLERLRGLGPDMPVNTLDEWFVNETYYSEPRRIEMGFSLGF